MADKNPRSNIKKKVGQELGFRTPSRFMQGSRFGKTSQMSASFNPINFKKTQHKG